MASSSGAGGRLAARARAWLHEAQLSAGRAARARAADMRHTLTMEHVRAPQLQQQRDRRRSMDRESAVLNRGGEEVRRDALLLLPRRVGPQSPAGSGVFPRRLAQAQIDAQRGLDAIEELDTASSPLLFDFRAVSERAHAQNPGETGRNRSESGSETRVVPTSADDLCFESADGAPWSWTVRCDSDIGGKSHASVAERLHRLEDPVVAGLDPNPVAAGRSPDDVEGALVFSGVLSMETSGKMVRSGYAAIECTHFTPFLDLSECDRFQMRVRTSGGLFVANVRTPSPIAHNLYQQVFSTPADEWVTLELPFSGFLATVRGKIDPIQRPFDEDSVQSIGFLMAQRVAGPFKFEMQWIRAVNTARSRLFQRYTADGYSADHYQSQREAQRLR
jgi:NADH dehydrogenase [ubiquinone] 1 alpha subcomplex assembly factor 1